MQVTCMATYPSTKQLTPYLQDIQHLEDKNDDLHPAPTQTTLFMNNDSLIRPKLFDTRSDRPWPASHTHSPKHLRLSLPLPPWTPIQLPPRPSSRDGEPQANMERRLFRTFQRWDRELCPNTGSPTDSTSMEPSDANSKCTNKLGSTDMAPEVPHPRPTRWDAATRRGRRCPRVRRVVPRGSHVVFANSRWHGFDSGRSARNRADSGLNRPY